jgi:hypothetical protein
MPRDESLPETDQPPFGPAGNLAILSVVLGAFGGVFSFCFGTVAMPLNAVGLALALVSLFVRIPVRKGGRRGNLELALMGAVVNLASLAWTLSMLYHGSPPGAA